MNNYNILGDGRGIDDTDINGHIIAVRNHGISFPKGYTLSFVLDGIEKERISTGSVDFQVLTGYRELDDDGQVISIFADKMLNKHLLHSDLN